MFCLSWYLLVEGGERREGVCEILFLLLCPNGHRIQLKEGGPYISRTERHSREVVVVGIEMTGHIVSSDRK